MSAVLNSTPTLKNERLEKIYGEPPAERAKPPHHLLETQIFSNVQKNEIFQVEPEQLSFSVNKSLKAKKVKVINSSGGRQNFHVIPPINQNRWSISYAKPEGGLVPGGHVEIQVKFLKPPKSEQTLQEGAIYQDSIRLHCLGENLVIPLYAYPTIDSKFFPSKINFGSVPLGQESHRTISLKAEDNDCFDFCCSLSPSCSAFSVSPWSGKISGESELKITYCPTEFVTSSTKLRITFSTFDRKVLECQINGNCLPGLLTAQKKREFELERKISFEKKNRRQNQGEVPNHMRLLERIQSNIKERPNNKLQKNSRIASRQEKLRKEKKKNETIIQVGAQHHINRILNSKVNRASSSNGKDRAYSEKAASFRTRLRSATEAEKVNKLRWQVRIGEDIPQEEEIRAIQNERAEYEITRIGDRTEREALSKPDYTPNFDLYRNSPWRGRHFALVRFQQAARTVLIRIRAEDRLSKLRKLMKLVNSGMTVNAAEATLTGSLDETKIFSISAPRSGVPLVRDFAPSCELFEKWKILDSFDDEVAEEQLPMENDADKLKPIYFSLQTPEYYKIQGYEASDAYGWSNHIFGLGPADPSLTEENSHSPVDWNYEELDASINNYNILSGKKTEERRVQKTGQRLSRWNSVTQGMNNSSGTKL